MVKQAVIVAVGVLALTALAAKSGREIPLWGYALIVALYTPALVFLWRRDREQREWQEEVRQAKRDLRRAEQKEKAQKRT